MRPNILTLEPYRCARDDFKEGILLDANENTHGPALSEVSIAEEKLELNRYPDPHQMELKQQIVDFRNSQSTQQVQKPLSASNLCLGVGSDESIDLLIRCVCVPGRDKLLICPPTYGMYSICSTVNDVAIEKVPLTTPDFQVDVKAVVDKVSANPEIKLLYLTSPGNPTGKLIEPEVIKDLLKQLITQWNGFVVVDEAYVDFAKPGSSFSPLVNEYPNLVVMQTLSKSFGLAGIRLGVTFASEELSFFLNAMKYPYNISSLTSEVSIRATSEGGLKKMEGFVSSIITQRGALLKELQTLDRIGENIGGLDANFLLLQILDKNGAPSNESALQLYKRLAVENAVVVRFRGTELNCKGALRISVGTAEENKTLVEKVRKCLKEIE